VSRRHFVIRASHIMLEEEFGAFVVSDHAGFVSRAFLLVLKF